MGQFKPMVKMYTDEPSVVLKLKKGGKVHHKAHHKSHEEHGHKAMHHAAGGQMHGAHHAFEAEHGKSPKKPSMAERRRSMNPQLYKKGGKVAHKLDGGGMPMGYAPRMSAAPMTVAPMAPMGRAALANMAPMGRSALMNMAPAARAARAAMVRRAITGMKKGGHTSHIAKLEKELHHHEALSASKAHGKHHKAEGGEIDSAETRTTIKGNAKKFEKDYMVSGQKHDSSHGTGEVKEGVPGGYKHGGKVHHISGHPVGSHEHHKHMAKHHAKMHFYGGSAHHAKMAEHHKQMAKMCKGGKYAVGGEVESESHKSPNKGKTVMGGTIEDNEKDYLETEMHEAVPDRAHGTGGVSMSNAGGFRKGGHHKVHRKAKGGHVPGLTGATIEGGNWENRPADTAKPGKTHTTTGEVKESNAGGYRKGGRAKKAFATGGNVVDDGKAVKMPHHFVSQPVANSLQSGTFRKGGKVRHHADGGSNPPSTISLAQQRQGYENWKKGETEDNEAWSNALRHPLDTIASIPGRIKRAFSQPSSPPGSVTQTEKSVTVAPKKRGGRTR
jgi:hypothetical protein